VGGGKEGRGEERNRDGSTGGGAGDLLETTPIDRGSMGTDLIFANVDHQRGSDLHKRKERRR